MGSGTVGAQEARPALISSTAANGWQYRITPYVWAAAVDRRVGFAGRGPVPPIDVSASLNFSDTLSRLDNGGMVFFEGRRDRFGFFGELLHIKTSDSASGSVSLPPAPIAKVDADLKRPALQASFLFALIENWCLSKPFDRGGAGYSSKTLAYRPLSVRKASPLI